jgi:hypothetical protein
VTSKPSWCLTIKNKNKKTKKRLLNIIPFPYFYGRLGHDHDTYVDRFQVVATANELPLDKYHNSFPEN